MAGPLSQMPMNVHPKPKSDETVAELFVEHLDGETSFDQIARAQASMPQIVERITELENCLWGLAEELVRFDPRNPQIERAKLLLKNRLEILDPSKPLQDGKKDPFDPLNSFWREIKTAAAQAEPETGKDAEGK
jgi:hypothetical protein